MDQKEMIIINDKWYYVYYRVLRKIWGLSEKEVRGLCGYARNVFCLSILTLVCFPLLIFGWIFLKACRTVYKILSKFEGGKKIIGLLDKINYGDTIEDLSDGLGEEPLIVAFVSGLIGLGTIGGMCLVVYALFKGSWEFLTHLLYIPGWILWLITRIGWIIFYIFAGIGYVMNLIAFVFCVIGSWVNSYWSLLGICVAVLIGGSIVTYLLIRFFSCEKMAWFRNFLLFKWNGFQEARKIAKERDEAIRVARAMAPRKESWFYRRWVVRRKLNVLGNFSLILEIIRSLIHGICPMVRVVSREEYIRIQQEILEDYQRKLELTKEVTERLKK